MPELADDPPGGRGDDDPAERLTAISPADERRVQEATDAAAISSLRVELATNRLVATATGVLMARHQVGPDDAFGLLVSVCQQGQRPIADVAAELVRTGTVSGFESLVGAGPRPAD